MELTSLKPQKFIQRLIYTFDYETDERMVKEKLVCLCKYNPISDKYRTWTFYSTEDFLNFVFDSNIDEIYAYNLKFDSRFFVDYLAVHQECTFSMIRGGSTILSLYLRKNDKEVRFRDFYPFCLTSLDNITKNFNLKHRKYPNFPDNDKDRWNHFFKTCSLEELEKHCIPDVKMLAELIQKYKVEFFNEYQIDITHKNIFSLAGLSMRVFRTHFITKSIHNALVFRIGREKNINTQKYEFVRKSYHGGYTGNVDTDYHENVVSYDISSSYPFQCMNIKFPTHSAQFINILDNPNAEEEFREYTKEIGGFCELSIDFTDTNVKFPLWNPETEEFKTVNGIWEGVLTSFEYEYLRNKKVPIKFKRGLYYLNYDKTYALKRYMETFYNRKKHAKTPEKRYISKILLNSLTGKFGQRIDLENRCNERIIFSKDFDTLNFDKTTYEEPIEQNDELSYIYQLERANIKDGTNLSIKSYSMVSWISLITAKGRIQLLEMIEKTNAFYWDTDSVYCSKEYEHLFEPSEYKNGKWISKTPTVLGKWEKEHEFKTLRVVAPKLYAGLEHNDNLFVRSKGINLNNDKKMKKEMYIKIMECIKELTIRQLRPLSLRQSLRIRKCTDISESGLVKSHEYNPSIKLKIKY